MDPNTVSDGKPKAANIDYVPYFAAGRSTEQINKELLPGDNMVMPSFEQFSEKYVKGGMVKPEGAKEFYDAMTESYKGFMDDKFNGYVAPRWMYSTGKLQGDVDRAVLNNKSYKYGLDPYGQPMATEQEMAAAHGTITRLDGTVEKYEPPSFFEKAWSFYKGFVDQGLQGTRDFMLGSAETLAGLDGKPFTDKEREIAKSIINAGTSMGKVMQGDLLAPYRAFKNFGQDEKPGIVTVVDMNDDGVYQFVEAEEGSDKHKHSDVVSVFGPQSMDSTTKIGDMVKSFVNVFTDLQNVPGTAMEMVDNIWSNLDTDHKPGKLTEFAQKAHDRAAKYRLPISQEGSQGAFDNFQSFMNQVTGVAAQLILQRNASGLLRALGTSPQLANVLTNFGVFGTISADSYWRAGEDMGINKKDLVWQAIAIGGLEGIVEQAVGPNLGGLGVDFVANRSMMRKIIKDEMMLAAKEAPGGSINMLSKQGRNAMMKNISKKLADFGDYLANPKNRVGGLISSFGEESVEEGVAQVGQNVTQMISDWNTLRTNPEASFQAGLWTDYDPKKSFLENTSEHITDGLLESMVIGGFGGMIGGVYNFNHAQDLTIQDFIVRGKADDLRKLGTSAYLQKAHGKPYLDEKGNVITANLIGQVESQNDLAYKAMMGKIDYWEGLSKELGIDNPAVLTAIGGNPDFGKQALQLGDQIKQNNLQIQKLQTDAPTATTEADIEKLKMANQTIQEQIDTILKPEVGLDKAASPYSKPVNDAIKSSVAAYSVTRDNLTGAAERNGIELSPEEVQLRTASWMASQAKAGSDPKNLYNVFVEKSLGFSGYVDQQRQRIEQERKAQLDTQTEINTGLEELGKIPASMEKGSINVSLASVIEQTNSIIAKAPKAANLGEIRQRGLQAINETVKKVGELIGYRENGQVLIDKTMEIPFFESDFFPTDRDLTDQEVKQREYENMVRNQIDTLNEKWKDLNGVQQAPVPVEKSEDEMFMDYIIGDTAAGIDQIQALYDGDGSPGNPGKFEGIPIDGIVNRLKKLEDALKEGYTFSTIGNILDKSGPGVKRHLILGKTRMDSKDKPITEQQRRNISEVFDRYMANVKNLMNEADKIGGSRTFVQVKYNQQHAEKQRLALMAMAPVLKSHIPNIETLVGELVALSPAQASIDSVPSADDEKILLENRKRIFAIARLIQAKRDVIFTKKNIANILGYDTRVEGKKEVLIARANNSRKFNVVADFYSSIVEGRETVFYENMIDLTKPEDMFSDVGYFYLVNFMVMLNGPDFDLLAKAEHVAIDRKAEEDAVAPVYTDYASSVEQSFSENLGVAHFLGNDNVYEAIKLIEREALVQEAQDILDPKSASDPHYETLPNAIVIPGSAGVGKTQQVIPNIIKKMSMIDGTKRRITVVSTGEALKLLEKQLGPIQRRFNHTMVYREMRDLFDESKSGSVLDCDILIIDEASYLVSGNYHYLQGKLEELKKRGKNPQVLLSGDETQMQPLTSGSYVTYMDRAGVRSFPLATIYSNDVPLIRLLADSYKKWINSKTSVYTANVPAFYKVTATGRRIGTQFLETPVNVIDEFLKSNEKDRALIFANITDYNKAIADNPTLLSLKDQIFLISEDIQKRNPNAPPSVQGLRFNEVYIAFSPKNMLLDDGQVVSSNNQGRAGYTSVTRARFYVAMPGNVAMNVTEDKVKGLWKEPNELVTAEQAARNQNAEYRKKRIAELRALYDGHNVDLDGIKKNKVDEIEPGTETSEPAGAEGFKSKRKRSSPKDGSMPADQTDVPDESTDTVSEEEADDVQVKKETSKKKETKKAKTKTKTEFFKIRDGKYKNMYIAVKKVVEEKGESTFVGDVYGEPDLSSTRYAYDVSITEAQLKEVTKPGSFRPITDESVIFPGGQTISIGDAFFNQQDDSIVHVTGFATNGTVLIAHLDNGEILDLANYQSVTEYVNEIPGEENSNLRVVTKRQWNHYRSVYAPAAFVFYGSNPTIQEAKDAVLLRPVILEKANLHFTNEMLFYKNIRLSDYTGMNVGPFSNVILVKASFRDSGHKAIFIDSLKQVNTKVKNAEFNDAANRLITILESDPENLELPDHHAFHSTIKQSDKIKANELDTLSLDKIRERITAQKLSKEETELNIELARIRKNAIEQVDKSGIMSLGTVFFISEPSHRFEKGDPIHYSELNVPGMIRDPEVFYNNINGKQALVQFYGLGEFPSDEHFLVFSTPLINQGPWTQDKDGRMVMSKNLEGWNIQSFYRQHQEDDNEKMGMDMSRNYKMDDPYSQPNKALRATWLNQMIMQNRSLIRGDKKYGKIKAFFDQYIDWVPSEDGKSVIARLNIEKPKGLEVIRKNVKGLEKATDEKVKKEIIKLKQDKSIFKFEKLLFAKMWHEIINTKIGGEIADKLYQPMDMIGGKITDVTQTKNLQTLYYKNHTPYTYISLNVQNIKPGVNDETDDGHLFMDDGVRFEADPAMSIGSEHTADWVNRNEVEAFMRDILAPEIWSDLEKDGFRPSLGIGKSGYEILGQLVNGRMKLVERSYGINKHSVKHEVFHLVYRYFLSPDDRARLDSEATMAMQLQGISNMSPEEFMARVYGQTGLSKFVYTNPKTDPWYTPKGILQRFRKVLDKITRRFNADMPRLKKLMHDIDHGKYRKSIPDYNLQTGIANNLPGEEFAEENVEDVVDNSVYAEKFSRMFEVFERTEHIELVRRKVAARILMHCNLSPTTDEGFAKSSLNIKTPMTVPQSIHFVEGLYQKEHEELGKTRVSVGGFKEVSIARATKNDFLEMNPQDQALYIDYQLGDELVYRAFVHHLFPKHDFVQQKTDRTGISTQYDAKKDLTPADTKNQFMRFMESLVPNYIYDENGHIVIETVTGKNGNKIHRYKIDPVQQTVNVNDLDLALREIGEVVMQRINENPDVDQVRAFVEAATLYADEVRGTDVARSNYVRSYLHRFWKVNYSTGNIKQIKHTSSLWEMANDPRINEDRRRELSDFMTNAITYYTSYIRQNFAKSQLLGYGDNRFNKIIEYSDRSEVTVKRLLTDNVYNALFHDGQIKQRVRDAIRGKNNSERTKVWNVTSDGLSFMRASSDGSSSLQLIVVKNGRPEWGPDAYDSKGRFNIKNLQLIWKFIGFQYVQNETFERILNGSANRLLRNFVNKYLPNVKDREGFISNMLPSVFMNMFWAVEANISAIESAQDLSAQYLRDLRDPDKKTEEVEDKYNRDIAQIDVPFVSEMAPLRKILNVTTGNIDDQFNVLDDEENLLEERHEFKFPKPTDYFEAFNIIGQVDLRVKGTQLEQMTLTPEKTRVWNYVGKSLFMSTFKWGTDWLLAKYDRILNPVGEARTEEALRRRETFLKTSPLINPEKKLWLNGLLDPVNRIRIHGVHQVLGHETTIKAVNEPNPHDKATMDFGMFIESLLKTANSELYIYDFPSSINGDSGTTYKISADFGNLGKLPLITLRVKDHKIVPGSVTVNEELINREINREFEAMKRRMDLSRMAWARLVTMHPEFAEIAGDVVAAKDIDVETMRSLRRTNITISMEQAAVIRMMLTNNNDYILKENRDGSYALRFGNSTLYHVPSKNVDDYGEESIYSYETYLRHSDNGKKNFKITTKARDVMFEDSYMNMATRWSTEGFAHRPDVANLLKGTDTYYTLNTKKNKGRGIKEWNPVYKAYFYGFKILHNAMDPMYIGHIQGHKDVTSKGKYEHSTHTPGTYLNTSLPTGVAKTSREIVVTPTVFEDSVIKNPDGTPARLKVYDGLAWGIITYEPFLERSFGGYEHGAIGKTMQKDLATYVDPITNETVIIKEATDFLSGTIAVDSIEYRRILKIALDSSDAAIMEEDPTWKMGSQYEAFMREYTILTKMGIYDMRRAADGFYNWVMEHPKKELIRKNLVSAFRTTDSHKGNYRNVNDYDQYKGIVPTLFKTNVIDNTQVKFVLNPHQDLNDKHNLAPMTQMFGYQGVGSTPNQSRFGRINAALASIYSIGKANIEKEKEDIDVTATDPDEIKDQQNEGWLRKVGLRIARAMNHITGFGQLVAQADLAMPQVAGSVTNAYRNYINKHSIYTRFSGIRANSSAGAIFEIIIDKEGNEWTMSDIEKRTGVTFEWRVIGPEGSQSWDYAYYSDAKKQWVSFKDLGFTTRPLHDMRFDEKTGKMLPGEIVMEFIHAKEFGIRDNESLSDVYRVYNKITREHNNLRGLSGKEVAAWIEAQIKEARSMEGGALRVEDIFDVDHSPILREVIRGQWSDYATYVDSLDDALHVYAGRVPAKGLPSGGWFKIVAFGRGNGNTIYIPAGFNLRTDADHDIDQLSVYFKSLTLNKETGKYSINRDQNTIDGLQNYIIDQVIETYKDKDNLEDIYILSTVAELRELAEKEEAKSDYVEDNDPATHLNLYSLARAGKEGIAILVNSLASYYYLATTNVKALATSFPEVAENSLIKGRHAIKNRMGDYLQALLDNPKEMVAGRLHIRLEAVNVLGVMLMDNMENQAIVDFMKHPIVEKVFVDVAEGSSVEQSQRDHLIFDVIDSKLEKLPKVEESVMESYRESIESLTAEMTARQIALAQKIEDDLFHEITKTKRKVESLDQASKIFTEFRASSIASPEWLSDELEQLDTMQTAIAATKDQLNNAESYYMLTALKGYAIRAEQLRRFADFISLRSGTKVLEWEVLTDIHKKQLYLGQTLEQWKDNPYPMTETQRVNAHIEYFKANSNEFLELGNDTIGIRRMLKNERLIAEGMNLPELIKQFPHLKMYLAEYIDQKKKYGKFFDYFNEFKNAARDAFFAAQQMRFFKYEGDYVGMQKAFSSMLLDYFFKTRHERSLFTVARPTQLVNGSWAMTDQFYNAVSLYREVDRKAFSKQVPELHNFFRDIALMEDEEEALRQLGAWLGAAKVMGLNMSPRALYNMVKNNSFLVNVMTFGKEESAYFGVDPDMARTPAMVAALHMEFRKLPIQIRRIYAFNEFYQGNLKWKPGSLLDIIGPEFQIGPESISESMPGFRRWLNEELKKQIAIDDSKQKDRVGLIDRFVKFTQHVRGMARTLSDERFRKDFIPAVITRSMKTKRGPFLKVQARYNPAKSKTLGIRGAYVPEYSVTQKLFDSQEDLNIDTDVIRLTADEVSSIKAAKRMGVEHTFTKSYPRGHGYEANVNYVTDTGDVVMLKEDGLSWVTWQTVGEQYSNLSLKAHVEYAEALATRGRSTPKSMVISQADVSLAGVDFLVDPGAKGKSDLDRVQSAVQYTLEVSDLVIKVRPEDTDIFKMFYINEYLTANLPEKETFNLNLWDAKALSNIKTMLNKVYQDTSADQQMVVTITGPDLPYMNMDQKETDQRMDIVMKTLARHVKDLGLDLSKIVIINAGQSGADSAIIHAARKWGFKTKIIAPKGYVYRNGRNNFTKGRENFVQRFQIPDELLTPEETQKVEKAANTTGKISKEDQQYLDMVDHMSNLKYTTGYGKGHEYSFPLSIILDGQRITANAFNYLIGHFEAKFPQLRFVRENFETLKQQNKDPYLRGWVQGNEIHFNEDMVTDATPFHEFQHVWDAIMEVENPELFQSIDGQIGALLDSPGDNNVKDLSKIIKTRYLAHNVVLNDAELRSEVRAVVAGLLTRDMLNRWLLKNGVMDAVRDNSYADKIWAELGWIGEENARWLKDLLSVGQLNADGIMTIEQAIMGFADKVLNGEGVYYISDNGLDALRSKKMMPSIGGPVDNVRDVLPLLMNDKRLAKAMLGQDVGHLTDMYYINMKKSKEGNDKDGYNYFLLYAGKKYSISTTATDDEIRKYVRESVVENILEWENQLQENTQKFILQTAGNVNQEGYKDNLVEAAKSLFGEKGLSQSAIDKLAVYLGLHNGAESVINYDQLRTHQNPHVRALYKEEFSGANPIVIIHNVNNTTGEVDLSILDVTSKPVGKQSDQVDRSNIFAAISPITDNEFVHDVNQNGVNKWSNSAAHIRKLMLTMTAMSMNNGKTRIRNIGVVRVNPRHVEGYMIHDLDSAFSLVRMIEEKVPALFERLPQAIKDVITNKEKNTGMVQPYTDRLMLYLADIAEDDSQSPEVRETATLQRNKIMETFNSKETVAKIVNVRMKYLESILGDPESNPEYQMLSAMLFEYSKGIPLHKGSYATMGWLERNLVSSHNVGSKPIQWFVTTAQNISARIKAQFYKDYGPGSKLYELGEILRKKHGPKGLASAKDIGSILYGPIRKTIKLKDMEIADKSNPALANLDPETEIRLPEFHWTMKDPETREKVLDPNDPLTEDHLKFAEEVHRLIREKYIDLIYHRESTSRKNMNETGESSFTRQDAEKMYDEVYGNLADSKHPYRRSMPVMSKSMNELFQSKSYKAVKKRFGQSIGASEMTNENFYDSTTDERKAKDLFNDMYNQMDYNNQLSKLGVYWNGANYVLSSYENNFMATDNFEKMTRYFLLESSRYIAFDNELMPVLKSVRAIHNLLEQQGVPAEDLKQEKEYLKQISERLIERINGDRNLKQDLNIFGLHMPLSKPIRIVSQAMSNAVLAFRVAVMAKSEIGNTRRALWDAMAQSIGDAIVKNAPEAERHYWPGVKQVFDGWWKSHISEIRKTWNLAKQLQVIRGSMDDMYSNPWLGNYDRLNPWKVSVMHIGNRFTDEMARAWGMVSIMIHDGSWEAYSYDKKNKKMVYDITKDRQYYQPDGTQTAEQKVLEEHLRRELVKDGLMVKETDELPQGYTLRDSMQRLKYFGDKFILSGLDEHTKPLLTNNYMGQLLGAFKMFQMEPLFAGSFAQERSVEHGGIKTVETDETGHMEVVYKDQKVEGGLTSVMKAYRAISEGLKDGKIQEHLGQMSPIARKNMARMCLNVATFAVFFAMIKGFVDKDKQMQFSFILSDILLIYMIGEWMTNPVPLAAQTKKLMDVAVGQRGIKYLLDFAGPLSDVRKYVMLGE